MGRTYTYTDLFCGIGGFSHAVHQATEARGDTAECLLASDIDLKASQAYRINHGVEPRGDIRQIPDSELPSADLVFGGFPCQAFSSSGKKLGFQDDRGTLYAECKRVIAASKPRAFFLENVKGLVCHDGGRTLAHILASLDELGYTVNYKVLNAHDYGTPQNRERICIIGFRDTEAAQRFTWPEPFAAPTLAEILEPEADVPDSFRLTTAYLDRREVPRDLDPKPYLWVTSFKRSKPWRDRSPCLTVCSGRTEIIVNGHRCLTPRERLRIQGFPETHQITHSAHATQRQAGNSVPVPMIRAVMSQVLQALDPIDAPSGACDC